MAGQGVRAELEAGRASSPRGTSHLVQVGVGVEVGVPGHVQLSVLAAAFDADTGELAECLRVRAGVAWAWMLKSF